MNGAKITLQKLKKNSKSVETAIFFVYVVYLQHNKILANNWRFY